MTINLAFLPAIFILGLFIGLICTEWWVARKRRAQQRALSAESVHRIMGAVRDVERRDDPGSLKSVSAADVLADEVGRFDCQINVGDLMAGPNGFVRVIVCGRDSNGFCAVCSAQQSAPETTISGNPPLDERKG